MEELPVKRSRETIKTKKVSYGSYKLLHDLDSTSMKVSKAGIVSTNTYQIVHSGSVNLITTHATVNLSICCTIITLVTGDL